MLMTLLSITMLLMFSPLLNLNIITNMMMVIFFITVMNFGPSFTPNIFMSTWAYMENFNLVMVLLSIFVSLLMILVSLNYKKDSKSSKLLSVMILLLLLTVMTFFMTDNLLVLYLTFEVSLIPTLILILIWGYQPERLQASFYFVLYTICASLPLMLIITKMFNSNFSFSMMSYNPLFTPENMFNFNLSIMALMMAFLVKLPSWGVHLWLPKAHVEAPISGSMILAGILLKLGGYGLMKMMALIYKIDSGPMSFFFSVSLWGTLAVSLVCISSMDMKSLIAYSSIIHMNMLVIGLLTKSTIGMIGAMMMMISHGISSPGMFALANYNYEKTLTRNLLLQKNISLIQPTLMMMWFMMISANMAAPPSLNLVSEILISMSILKLYTPLFLIIIMITVLSGVYNLYLFSAQLGNKLFIVSSLKSSSIQFLILTTQIVPCYLLTFIIPICMSI